MRKPFGIVFAIAATLTSQSASARQCGWELVSGVAPPLAQHAMAYDSKRDRVVVFGGSNGGAASATREWDGQSWIVAPPSAGSPGAFHGVCMVYDEARQECVLFVPNFPAPGITWTWDGVAWRLASSVGPASRWYSGMAYDSKRSVVVMFGGQGEPDVLQDTWEWNGEQWTLVAESGPGRRRSFGIAFDEARGVVVLHGGMNWDDPAFVDTWEWDGSEWRQTVSQGPLRSSHAMAYDKSRRRVVLFGGTAGCVPTIGCLTRDIWEYADGRWTAHVDVAGPSRRLFPGLAYHGPLDRMVMWGGSTMSGDTWLWAGSTYRIVAQPESVQSRLGEEARFFVRAAQRPNSYRWYRNFNALGDGGNVSGSSSPTLTVSPVTLADAGVYYCRIESECGWEISEDATLSLVCCPADPNGDCEVNAVDLNIVLSAFGMAGPSILGDVNQDGVVDFADLNLVLTYFGAQC